jgi:hypothetical protein
LVSSLGVVALLAFGPLGSAFSYASSVSSCESVVSSRGFGHGSSVSSRGVSSRGSAVSSRGAVPTRAPSWRGA